MKKICVGFMSVFFVLGVAGATATTITTATTNTARKQVYDITYGASGTVDDQGYRKGVTPQTNELTAARGTTSDTITSVSLGSLAATDTGGTPTKTITANTANVAVLQRDKLHVPTGTTGNCEADSACGYVTTGNAHSASEKIWLKIQ